MTLPPLETLVEKLSNNIFREFFSRLHIKTSMHSLLHIIVPLKMQVTFTPKNDLLNFLAWMTSHWPAAGLPPN